MERGNDYSFMIHSTEEAFNEAAKASGRLRSEEKLGSLFGRGGNEVSKVPRGNAGNAISLLSSDEDEGEEEEEEVEEEDYERDDNEEEEGGDENQMDAEDDEVEEVEEYDGHEYNLEEEREEEEEVEDVQEVEVVESRSEMEAESESEEAPVIQKPKRQVKPSQYKGRVAVDSARKRLRYQSDIDEDVSAQEDVLNRSISTSTPAAQLLKLTLENDELKLQNEELHERLMSQKSEFEREKEKHSRQLQFAEIEIEKVKCELVEKNEKYFDMKKKMQAFIRTSETEKATLQAKITSLESRSKPPPTTIPTTTHVPVDQFDIELAVENWKQLFSKCENDLKTKSTECLRLNNKIVELEQEIVSLQQKIIIQNTKLPSSGEHAIDSETYQKLIKTEKMLKLKLSEIEKLKGSISNQNLLQEEIENNRRKIVKLENELNYLRDVEVKYKVLADERELWSMKFHEVLSQSSEMLLDRGGNSSIPIQAVRLLSHLQHKLTKVLASQGHQEIKLAELSTHIKSLEEQMKVKDDELRNLTQNNNEMKIVIDSSKRKASIYEAEVKSLRDLLQTYNTEMKFGKGIKDRTSLEKFKSEGDVALKEKLITELRGELDALRKAHEESLNDVKELKTLLETEKAKVLERGSADEYADKLRNLKTDYDKLNAEFSHYKSFVGFDFIPTETKVFHLKDNPSLSRYQQKSAGKTKPLDVIVKSVLKNYHDDEVAGNRTKTLITTFSTISQESKDGKESNSMEIDMSQNNISMLASSAPSSNLSSITSSTSTSGIDSNKMNQRLKEMFKERISSFREAVYLLTGYKIDLLSTEMLGNGAEYPQLRLKSMYADDPNDALLFQWKGDALQLIETSFTQKIDPDFIRILQHSNSVPVFTSSITQDLFERQTRF